MTFQCCFVVLWIFISYSPVTTAELVCPKSSVRLVSGKDISLYVLYGSGSGLYPIHNLMSSESCTYWCSRTFPNHVTIYLNEPFLLEGLVTEGKEDLAEHFVSEFNLYYSPPNGTLLPFLKFRLPSPNRFAFLFSRSIQTSYLKLQVKNVYSLLYNYCWHLELLGCHLSEAVEQSQAVPNPIPAPSQSMNVYSFNPKASESEIYFTPIAVTVSDDICSDTTVRIIETSILVMTETITRIQDSITSIVEPSIDRVTSTDNEYLTGCAIPILLAIVLPIVVAILFLIVIILTWIIKHRYNARMRSGTLREVSNNTLYSSMSNDETETIRRVRNSLYVNDTPEYPGPPLVLSAPYREFESSQAPLISSSHQDNIYAELDTYKHEHKESSLKYERVH